MNTIEEIVTKAREEDGLDVLVPRLVAREQEAVERLQEVAMQFNLMPAVVAKVIQHLGLGEPPSDEMREYVDQQYADLLVQVEQQRLQAIEKYREMGVQVTIEPLVDPLATGAPESLVIPDSPPEA